jgi:hypothetical protein
LLKRVGVNERLKSAGGCLIWVILLVGVYAIAALLLHGAAYLSDKLLPTFVRASGWTFAISLVLLLPLSALSRTRVPAACGIYLASYLFGITLWMEGLLNTLDIWGGIGVFIGLFLLGLGVVPIGLLAALTHGLWWNFFDMVFLAVLAFGARSYAMARLAADDIAGTPTETTSEPEEDFWDHRLPLPEEPEAPEPPNATAASRYVYCGACKVRVGRADTSCKRCGQILA